MKMMWCLRLYIFPNHNVQMNVPFYMSKTLRLTIKHVKQRELGVRYILVERKNFEGETRTSELTFREIAYIQCHPLQFNFKEQEWIYFWGIIPRIVQLMV